MPFRTSPLLDRVPRRVVAGGLAVSAICGLVLLPPVLDGSRVTRPELDGPTAVGQPTEVVGSPSVVLTPVPADFDQLAVKDAGYRSGLGCQSNEERVCTYTFGSGPHIMLMGDSNALMMQTPLLEIAQREGLTLSLADAPRCMWQQGLGDPDDPGRDECRAAREPIYEGRLAQLGVDVVVAVNVMEAVHMGDPSDDSAPRNQETRAATEASVEKILDAGAELVLIEPMPRAPVGSDPVRCLGESMYLEECRFVVDDRPYWVDVMWRDLEERHEGVHSIDLDRAVCPGLPVCDPIVDGVVVRWDDAHLTKAFSETLVDDLTDALRSRGLLGR